MTPTAKEIAEYHIQRLGDCAQAGCWVAMVPHLTALLDLAIIAEKSQSLSATIRIPELSE